MKKLLKITSRYRAIAYCDAGRISVAINHNAFYYPGVAKLVSKHETD
ncbi:hypothetical protein [Mangrovibacter phragmitis]